MAYRGVSLKIRRKGRGLRAKTPPSSSFPRWKTGEGRRSGGGLRPAAQGSTALREEREKGEGSTWSGSPATARAEMARGALATAAGGQQVAAVLGRSPGGLVAVKGRGKRERESRETCSPPRFGPGRSEEVGPRRRAASNRGECGGGTGGSGGGCAAVEAAVDLEGEEGGLLIGVARRWRLGGTRWGPASGAGRH